MAKPKGTCYLNRKPYRSGRYVRVRRTCDKNCKDGETCRLVTQPQGVVLKERS